MSETYEMSGNVEGLSSSDIYFSVPPELGPFRPSRITVPHDVAPHFLVTNVKVGHNSQFVTCPCVPASLFDESLPPTDLHFDLLPTNKFFTVSVTNASPETRLFKYRVTGNHDVSKVSPDGLPNVMGLGHTLASPEARELTLRVQPQLTFAPRRLYVPESVLQDFRINSLGKHPAYTRPPSPDNRFPTPDAPSDSPLTSAADPASLSHEKLLAGRSVELHPDPVVRRSEFVVLRVTLTSDRPAAFCGAMVGTVTWP